MIIDNHRQIDTKKDYKKNKTEETERKKLFSRRRKDIIAHNNNASKPFKMAINLFADKVYIVVCIHLYFLKRTGYYLYVQSVFPD